MPIPSHYTRMYNLVDCKIGTQRQRQRERRELTRRCIHSAHARRSKKSNESINRRKFKFLTASNMHIATHDGYYENFSK